MGRPSYADVLVVGEALVDVVESPDGRLSEAPGGSPLNVAVTLARLGVATELLTAFGDDERGDAIEAHLAGSGVAVMPGARRLDRTSTALARLGPDGSANYEFDVDWALDEPPLPDVDVVHAGSLALFLEPGATAVCRLLEKAAREPGVLVSLDPNIRPSLLPARDVVATALERVLPLAHVVKLSDEDAAWLFPGLAPDQVLDHLLGHGAALVAITRGADGCVLAGRDGRVEVPSVETVVVDTIGAGDSFMGALLHQLLTRGLVEDLVSGLGLWPEELALVGTAAAEVAAITVGRPGADPPYLAELAGTRTVVARS